MSFDHAGDDLNEESQSVILQYIHSHMTHSNDLNIEGS